MAARPSDALVGACLLACLLVCRPGPGAAHQTDPLAAGKPPARYELKFQNELDNSTVIKRPAQQQVFKCQVRLAPLGRGAAAGQPRRLKSASSWLTGEAAQLKRAELVRDSHHDQLGRMLLQAAADSQPAGPNVTHFFVEWLRDGRPVWDAFWRDELAIVNVTLKTQRNQDKGARPTRPRLEIKNTLNAQQLKLTSRFRLGRLQMADAGEYKCVARVRYLQRAAEPAHGLVEYIEQSLESLGAHLVVRDSADAGASDFQRPDEQKASAGYSSGEPKPRLAADEAARPQVGQPDDTQDGDETAARTTQVSDGAAGRPAPNTPLGSPFEDDEDLFRLDIGELINGQQQRPQQSPTSGDSIEQPAVRPDNAGDTMDSHANDLLVSSQPIARERPHEAYLDWILDNGADPARDHHWVQPAEGADAGVEAGPGARPQAGRPAPGRNESLPSASQRPAAGGFGDKKIDDQAPIGRDVSNSSEAGAAGPQQQWPGPWQDKRPEVSGESDASGPLDHHHADHAAPSPSTFPPTFGQRRPLPPPADPAAARSKLAKFVHKIVPEPSCYTGAGEHYRGNVSTSADQRPCLNWQHVRSALSRPAGPDPLSSAIKQSHPDDHNHCRNPNSDQRGPWCFVLYSEELDGVLVARPYRSAGGRQWKTATSKQRTVRLGADSAQLFVVAPCQLASCSEYLWLYVVAPPFGLLVLLSCLISLTIRSIRRSHYNAIFSAAYQRHSDPNAAKSPSGGLLCGFMQPRKRLVVNANACHVLPKRDAARRGLAVFRKLLPFSAAPSSPRKRKLAGRGRYLNDDMFEVVDDINWSDGQPTSFTSQSMSPSESFRLQSTPTATCDELAPVRSPTGGRSAPSWSHRSTLTHSKSINPVYGTEQVAALDLPIGRRPGEQHSAVSPDAGSAHKMSKSKSQVGPMFATLRCHVRNAHQHQQQHQQRRQLAETGGVICPLAKKSNSFVESHQLAAGNQQPAGSFRKREATTGQAHLQTESDCSLAAAKTGLLLSCNSSSSDETGGATQADSGSTIEKFRLASELPRLDASSVTLAYDAQPIYEGKFSQVQMAYIKQRKDDLAQATGRIGAQVAVCSLKGQAALDESVFYPTNLRLRHLNHLNILKLLGYVNTDNYDNLESANACNASSIIRTNLKCSLVYDMAHLIDLNDWLKQQCKDSFEAHNDCELSLRQNLTCIAKQVALALDYLHDKNIIYKDLACRNCFLDVTRMLVKLASFNIEPEFDNADGAAGEVPGGGDFYDTASDDDLISKKASLKSMVRPKYLLDYYVIDSRPAECQLLPLSWISLESILFNKFNKHTDIWSFGCLLYELFSLGEVAYFGYSSKQVIDSVRSNLMPPQPLLCPNGIYKLMCKCLSDIPTLRPNIKHVYEQLNLYSGQCSSFLNHHLCII